MGEQCLLKMMSLQACCALRIAALCSQSKISQSLRCKAGAGSAWPVPALHIYTSAVAHANITFSSSESWFADVRTTGPRLWNAATCGLKGWPILKAHLRPRLVAAAHGARTTLAEALGAARLHPWTDICTADDSAACMIGTAQQSIWNHKSGLHVQVLSDAALCRSARCISKNLLHDGGKTLS